jgi:caa(3)-type oxidase subunit IV
MSDAEQSAGRIWIGPLAVWFALILLLIATVSSAYIPLGIFNGIINMTIAGIKVALVVLFFMEVRTSSPLIRLASMAGLFWLILMFSLAGADYFTRQ